MNEYARAIKEALVSRIEMKGVLKMGYPVGIQMALESSTFTFAAVMAGWLGVLQLAAHQVVITISQLFFLMMQGLLVRRLDPGQQRLRQKGLQIRP